jgi:cobalt-precorrin 5A hydrolase
MGFWQTMIVAGVGCRRGAAAAEIEAAIAAALARAGLGAEVLMLIATGALKAHEGGIVSAATRLHLPLVLVSRSELQLAASRAKTHATRVQALVNVPSVAEAAALAAAGPAAYLLGPRVALGPATCALAQVAP